MRTLAILMAALVMAVSPSVALAKSDKTPPGQADKAQDSDAPGHNGHGEPSGPGKNHDKPDPPGQAKKPDEPPGQVKKPDEPPGQVKKPDEPPGQAKKPDDPTEQAVELMEAQRAVETHQALPLARIVAVAATRSEGRVVNAKLMRIDDTLLYELTLLDETGRSWREYYYARTGNPVIIP